MSPTTAEPRAPSPPRMPLLGEAHLTARHIHSRRGAGRGLVLTSTTTPPTLAMQL